jgi:hypothetical protein
VARSGIGQFTGVQHLNESIGRAVLAATTDDTPATEGIDNHGVFTYALLEGLSQADTNGDGIVDVAELGAFVRRRVPELTSRFWGIRQVPQAMVSGAGFQLTPKSPEPFVAALPDNRPTVLASATHTLIGPTAVRQADNGVAIDIAELNAGARVRVIQTRGEWNLIAQNGNVIGYVEAQQLQPINANIQVPQVRTDDQEYDPMSAVKAFYSALSRADGEAASALVISEKRGKSPFNAFDIKRFYSGLQEPLRIIGIERAGSDSVEVTYQYTRVGEVRCQGRARVDTAYVAGETLIKRISANC